jgi:two-component system, cell cycle response regulator
MSNLEGYLFHRDSACFPTGRGLGRSNLEGGQGICKGDIQSCDKPDVLMEQVLEQRNKEVSNSEKPVDQEREPLNYKVLVVDDQERMRKTIAAILSKQEHQCVTATNGIEALNKVNQTRFDAVIADIVMPEMDGIVLTKEISSLYPNLPIMVMTGHGKEYSAESVITAGARDFIEKPFSIDEFILRFKKMMHNHEEEKALLTIFFSDELTGLYNRRRFFVLTEHWLKLAIRTQRRLSLLYMDLDGLKWINDQYGHKEGDQALIGFANILKKTFRESDIVARIGGDEFVALIESTDDEVIMTRLLENIKDYNAQESQRYVLSISVGTAHFEAEHPTSINELLSKADGTMYAEKRRKRMNQSPP